MMSLFIIVIGLVIAAVILYFTWRNLNESSNGNGSNNGSTNLNGNNVSSNGSSNGSNNNGSTGGTIPIDNDIEETESAESGESVKQEDDAPSDKLPEREEPINQLLPYEEQSDDPLESVNPVTPSDNQP